MNVKRSADRVPSRYFTILRSKDHAMSLHLFDVPPAVVERVRQIASPATPIGPDETRDLARAWLELNYCLRESQRQFGELASKTAWETTFDSYTPSAKGS